jgi:3-dehydroquinate dehydratase
MQHYSQATSAVIRRCSVCYSHYSIAVIHDVSAYELYDLNVTRAHSHRKYREKVKDMSTLAGIPNAHLAGLMDLLANEIVLRKYKCEHRAVG